MTACRRGSAADRGHDPTSRRWHRLTDRPGHHPDGRRLARTAAATFTFNCSGSACQFDGTGSFDPNGIIATYLWNFGDGTTSSGPAPAHQYATGATYRVTLSVTDQNGATDVALMDVAANAPPSASFTAQRASKVPGPR